MQNEHWKPSHKPIWLILGLYITFSTLWIYFSDRFLFLFITDPEQRIRFSVYKGTLFVIFSAALLYLLLLRYAKKLQAAGEALRAGEHRFHIIADSVPNFVWTARPDGTVDYINSRFREYTGHETYLRDDSSTPVHPDDEAATMDAWAEALATGTLFEVKHRLRSQDGTYRWFICRGVPVKNQKGELIQWYGISTDIDDLQSANERIQRSAEALRMRTAELESVLVNAPIGLAFFNREHRYVRVNNILAEMNGISEENSIGKTISELLPVNARTVDPILEKVFATGRPVQAEVRGETPKEPGAVRYWLTGFFPVFTTSSEPVAVGAYVVEITERKRAEQEMARLAAIVEGAEDAIFSENLDGFVQTWNRGAERLYGYSADEIIGKHISMVIPPENTDELERMAKVIKEGRHDRFETTRINKSGKRFFASITMSPIKDAAGRIVGVSKIAHDLSRRKQEEENLRRTLRALERANRDLQQFAYVASHDLQEPLRNVSRYVELLGRRYRGRLDDKADSYIGFAIEGAKRIHSLISDLLVFSELGATSRKFKGISMQKIAEEAIGNLRQAIEENGAIITMGAMPEVLGVQSQLVQLLQNLVGNAVKFHKKDERPQIHISAEKALGEWRFAVRDNGIGIDPQYLEKIFVMFQRLHPRSEYPGTGIGLAICRKIAELHDGKIWAESKPGEGATFFFTISSPER